MENRFLRIWGEIVCNTGPAEKPKQYMRIPAFLYPPKQRHGQTTYKSCSLLFELSTYNYHPETEAKNGFVYDFVGIELSKPKPLKTRLIHKIMKSLKKLINK